MLGLELGSEIAGYEDFNSKILFQEGRQNTGISNK